MTPVFLGVCLGALASGAVPRAGKTGFRAAFVAPWLTPFCFGVGILTLTLFAFLASVYLNHSLVEKGDRLEGSKPEP